MLPGLRVFIAATVLTAALVVFAVGAAALLRATHQVAALPPWQPPPAVMFVGRAADEAPTLSLVRVDEPRAGLAEEPDVPVAAPVAAVSVDVLPAIASVDEMSIAAAFPAPPEPVVRDATADVLAALPAAVPTETVAPVPSESETHAEPPPPAGAVADLAPVADEAVAPAVAALTAPPSDAESAAEPASGTVETIEAVPDAVVAHPPLPRIRPSEREIAARKAASAAAAAKKARAAALRRRAAVARARPQVAAPQPDPFASPFAPAFAPVPAATPGR